MNLILEQLGHVFPTNGSECNIDPDQTENDYNIPVIASWRLNERHYGDLVGLSKVCRN